MARRMRARISSSKLRPAAAAASRRSASAAAASRRSSSLRRARAAFRRSSSAAASRAASSRTSLLPEKCWRARIRPPEGAASSSSSSAPKERRAALRVARGFRRSAASAWASASACARVTRGRSAPSKGSWRSSAPVMRAGKSGRSSVPTSASLSLSRLKMVAPATLPKIVCLRFSCSACWPTRKKNCEALPLSELAIATTPLWLNRSREWISSGKGSPYAASPPSPVPVGSPVWMMKSLTMRWKMHPV
mmetsp:Transcript_8615/g.35906  ORF Transcript_8615/g.35906 Transcript_8615/m.35906 type:complete len:249 (-) Transcript_8615:191-937(-)